MKNRLSLLLCGLLLTSHTTFAEVLCQSITEQEVAGFFDNWNETLKSGNPARVVEYYAEDAVLLPTVSNKIRLTQAERLDYFEHFMANKPIGKINQQIIKIGCNQASNSGFYTFTFADNSSLSARFSYNYIFKDGHWLISSHHSSLMPEK